MLNIYEYSRDSVSYPAVSYIVAADQPTGGGCLDTPADLAAYAAICPMVAGVADLDAALEWIAAALPIAMRRFTLGEYSVRERMYPRALLCITAESKGC